MSYVFKQIDSSYKTSTPFYAHKKWTLSNVTVPSLTIEDDISLGEISMSILYGKYTQSKCILLEDEEMTRNGEFSRNVWHSVNTLYYRNFQNSPYEYYKYGSVGVETRDISEVVQVFSIPQKIIGEGIKPGSFRLQSGVAKFFDDGNGNILGYRGSPNLRVFNTGSIDLYYCSFFFYDSFKYAGLRSSFKSKSHGNLRATTEWNLDSGSGIAAPVHGPNYLTGRVTNLGVSKTPTCPATKYFLDFKYDTTVTGSSYVRVYHAKELNFDVKDPLTISMWVNNANTSNGTVNLISKNGRRRIYRNPINTQVTAAGSNYNTYISDEVYGGPYPFAVVLNGSTVTFSISDGATTSQATANIGGGWNLITCRKDSGSLQVFVNTTAGTVSPCGCLGSTKNDADVFIGAMGDKITADPIPLTGNKPNAEYGQFNGAMGPVHIFNKKLTDTEISNLYNEAYNNRYGNILYKQGMIIWTNHHGNSAVAINKFDDDTCAFDSMQFRSTKQITTNEFICAVGPGELNMTTNPSVLIRSSVICNTHLGSGSFEGPNEQGECYSFVTGSGFSPYVTGIGLYNDRGELLVVGKLATPIKKPTNCDLILVVKWDE